jgi:hypothetical protein
MEKRGMALLLRSRRSFHSLKYLRQMINAYLSSSSDH